MNAMKRWLVLSLLACMLFSLSACGGNEGVESPKTSSSVASAESSESEDGEDSVDSEETQEYCTVSFDTDGGNAIEAVEVEKGEKLTPPANPVKSSVHYEYEFLGWYHGEKVWNFEEDIVTDDITLKAKWKVSGSYSEPFLPKD